jgi:hypothetical protein
VVPQQRAGPSGGGAQQRRSEQTGPTVPTFLTDGLGELVMRYIQLIAQPVRVPEQDFQVLIDDAFGFIVSHRQALMDACDDDQSPTKQGLCLKWVWHGLFRWPRMQGGYQAETNYPLPPSKYYEKGLRAALDAFPSDILNSESEQFTNYLLHRQLKSDTYRRIPLINPQNDGAGWDVVYPMLQKVIRNAYSIPGEWATTALLLWLKLSNIEGFPISQEEQDQLNTTITTFITETPAELVTHCTALMQIIQKAIQNADKLHIGYAGHILQLIHVRERHITQPGYSGGDRYQHRGPSGPKPLRYAPYPSAKP